MLILLLPILSLSEKIKLPKMSFLFVDEDMSSSDIDELKEMLNLIKSSIKNECDKIDDKDEKQYCKETIDSLLGIEGSNGKDLSKKISKINKKTDFLFYAGTSIDETIDFSKLKSKMCVIMVRPDLYSKSMMKTKKVDFYADQIKRIHHKLTKTSFDGSQESIIKLVNSFESKKNKNPKSKTYANLAGNIKDKVSFLTISDYSITIVGSDLNCHSLYLYDSHLDTDSKKVQTSFLYADIDTHSNLFDQYESQYVGNIDQYSLIIFLGSSVEYKIIYEQKSWCVHFRDYETYDLYVLYTFANTFGLYVLTNSIVIRVDDTELELYKQLNITISYDEPLSELPHYFNDRSTVTFKTEGNWDSIANKPKIILTTNKEDFKIEKEEGCQLNFDLQEPYSYKVKNNGPNVGMIVGIVIACVVVVAAIVVLIVFLYLRKKKKSQEKSENEGETAQETQV